MAENKETLRIEAELDTSKLKKDAQKGFNEVSNEEKKLESQTKATSNAVDGLGNSLSKTSGKGSQALKQMGNEADKTASKIQNIERSVQRINVGRALGVAAQLANTDLGREIGSNIGNALGMDESQKGLAGGAFQGGVQGANIGASIGGVPGAAIGLLVGAGSGLLNAAKQQEKAAIALLKSAEDRQRANQQRARDFDTAIEKEKADKAFNDKLSDLVGKGDFKGANELIKAEMDKAKADFEVGSKGIHNTKIQMDATPEENRGAHYKSFDDFLNQANSGLSRMKQLEAIQKQVNNAEANAGKQADAQVKAEEKKKLQAELSNLTNEKSSLEETLSQQLAGAKTRLTDSLTSIGGGSGYYGQNTGIVENIDRTLKEKLGSIDIEIKAIKDKISDNGTNVWN